MKSLKSLFILAIFAVSAFVLSSSKCKGNDCTAPSIVFDPSGTSITKAPGEKINLSIVVTGDADNIASIIVTKTSNGVTDPAFISVTGIGSKGKTVTLVDSVPESVTWGSVISYTVTATSDCKDAVSDSKTLTVTIGPSSTPLDFLIYGYENGQRPKVYSRYSVNPSNNSAWQFVLSPNAGEKFAADPNIDKDARDSIVNNHPFTGNTRWGSRNGSKFVMAPGFDWANASAKSIIDAYNKGTPSDLISFAAGDYFVVNIKNSNKYAVVKIRSVVDDGAASNEDYTLFSYILAQK